MGGEGTQEAQHAIIYKQLVIIFDTIPALTLHLTYGSYFLVCGVIPSL